MTIQDKELIIERGTKYVFRTEDKIIKEFKPGYPKSAVLKEAFNHALAEETGLPVPELLAVENVDGGWSLIIKNIPGRTMAELSLDEKNLISHRFHALEDLAAKL